MAAEGSLSCYDQQQTIFVGMSGRSEVPILSGTSEPYFDSPFLDSLSFFLHFFFFILFCLLPPNMTPDGHIFIVVTDTPGHKMAALTVYFHAYSRSFFLPLCQRRSWRCLHISANCQSSSVTLFHSVSFCLICQSFCFYRLCMFVSLFLSFCLSLCVGLVTVSIIVCFTRIQNGIIQLGV